MYIWITKCLEHLVQYNTQTQPPNFDIVTKGMAQKKLKYCTRTVTVTYLGRISSELWSNYECTKNVPQANHIHKYTTSEPQASHWPGLVHRVNLGLSELRTTHKVVPWLEAGALAVFIVSSMCLTRLCAGWLCG